MRHRVVLFTTSLGGGGAELQVVQLANHLDRERFDVHVVVARSGGRYEARLIPNLSYTKLTTTSNGSSSISLAASIVPLRRLLAAEQPSIICSFLEGPNIVAHLATTGLTAKHVVCLQNTWTEKLSNARLGRRALTKAAIYSVRNAAHCIALSEGVADDIIRLSGIDSSAVSVIYNGPIDNDIIAKSHEPPETPLPPSPVIVACGRLVPQKGFDYLIDALPRMVTRPNLVVIGEGPAEAALRARASARGVSDRVMFTGARDNPYAYMRQGDLFVLSSVFEGFGNVLAEAMAVGTPVVASDCPHGPSEIIGDRRAGILVPPRDAAALAEACDEILSNAPLAGEYKRHAQQRAHCFRAEQSAKHYGATLEMLLGAPP